MDAQSGTRTAEAQLGGRGTHQLWLIMSAGVYVSKMPLQHVRVYIVPIKKT